MATYKTKDGTQTGFVPGIGEIVEGMITVPDGVVIENANLEKVEETPTPQQPQPQIVQAAPVAPAAHVTPAAPVAAPAASTTATTDPTQALPTNEQPLNKEAA